MRRLTGTALAAALLLWVPSAASAAPLAVSGAGSVRTESNTCMVVVNADPTDNTSLATYGCGPEGQANQTWAFYDDDTLRGLSGKCVTVPGDAVADGTGVVLATCAGKDGQKWWAGPDGTLVNRWSGRCLAALDPGTNGGGIAIKDCDPTVSGQRWSKASWAAPDGAQITGLGGKCMDGGGRDSAFATRVTLWECGNSAGQRWSVGDNEGRLTALGQCLDAKSGTDAGTPLELAACDSTSESQHWLVEPGGTLRNKSANRCAAVSGAATADGTDLVLADCGTGAEQVWEVPFPQ